MPLSPEQKRTLTILLVAGVVGLLGMLYYWFMFGQAEIEDNHKKKAEIEAKRDEIKKQLDTIQEFEQLTTTQFEELESIIKKASRVLPQSRHPEEFLIALRDVLGKTGILTQKLSPDPVAEYDRFAEIPYSIKATGRYHDFGVFLSLVEQNPDRFMRLKTLKITNDLKHPSFHPIELGVGTFMLKSDVKPKEARKKK